MSATVERMAEAVRAAREAVTDLEEPLKTEAFKILLDKLLSDGAMNRNSGAGRQTRRTAAKVRAAGGKHESRAGKATRAARPATSLHLDVSELKALKAYCEGFELQGTEQIAFILANFVREHAKLEFVTAADIEYLYRQLVSQRVKVTPVNDFGDWSRALNWLTAPSRRKEWLVRSGGGYVVSNAGLLRFHELEEKPGKGTTSRAKP
jgi:hypothetical protein